MAEPLIANADVLRLLASDKIVDAIKRAAKAKLGDVDGETHGFYTWAPRPKLEYQHHVMQCDAQTIALTLPNQAGKTMSGSRFVAAHMIGHEPLYPGRAYKTPIKVWAVTAGSLVEGLFDELLAMIPPAEIDERDIKRSTGRFRFKLRNGSKLEMKMFDQKVDAFKQAKCDIVWLDELPVDFEAKWVELHIRLLRKGGIVLLTGTPDKYGHAWLKRKLVAMGWGDARFKNAHSGPFAWFKADMRDNDTLDPTRVEDLVKKIGNDPEMFAIKVLGEWPDTEGSNVFPAFALNDQRKFVVQPARFVDFDDFGNPYERQPFSGWSIYEDPMPGYGYAIGADLSEGGERSDYSSVHVVKILNAEVVATWHGRIDPIVLARSAVAAGHYYNDAIIAPEVNGRQGGAFISVLRERKYPHLFRRPAHGWNRDLFLKTTGWETDQFNKPRIVFETKRLLVDGKLVIPCGKTLDEMNAFQELRVEEPGRNAMGFGAVEGNDDRVMSLMIALQATKQGIAYTRASIDEVFQHKNPRIAMAVAMVQGHLKEQKQKRRDEIEGWW